jgi:hypothetical protein
VRFDQLHQPFQVAGQRAQDIRLHDDVIGAALTSSSARSCRIPAE